MIDRKALNISLSTNASDYSIGKVYVLVSYKYCSFAGVFTLQVGEQ